MGSLKALTLAGGVAIAAATAAHAADLPMPPPMPAPAVMPAIETSGWYLRGDVGLGANNNPKLRTTPDPLAGYNDNFTCDPAGGSCYSGVSSTYGFHNPTVSHSTFVDLGIGYQFNSWLRADATIEWRGGAHLQAVDSLASTGNYSWNGGPTVPWNKTLHNFYRGNVSSIVGMVNGYIDLGTFWGITPYIGAGAGVAQNRLSGLTDQGISYDSIRIGGYNQGGLPSFGGTGAPDGSGGYFKDGKKTSFAWALMAGLSYSVTSNLKLELGYRYMNLGKISSGKAQCFDQTTGVAVNCGDWKVQTSKLDSHDVRIGMRWMLGAPEAPAPVAYFPPPLRSKF